MYKSFDIFSVSDERELRDPERLRRLARARHSGDMTASVLLAAGGVACLGLGAAGIYIKLFVASAPGATGWSIMFVGFFFGIMMLAMAAAFLKEFRLCPVRGCLREPQQYEFLKGRLTEAVYLYSGEHSSEKMLVKGECGDGLLTEFFEPDLWSGAVAEGGEESLKPGDDRYDQKGRRLRLPIEVWAVRRIGGRAAALAGIPAGTVERLNKAAGKK